MRLNGRGIHREEVWKNGGDPIAVTTEEGVFGLLGLEYIGKFSIESFLRR